MSKPRYKIKETLGGTFKISALTQDGWYTYDTPFNSKEYAEKGIARLIDPQLFEYDEKGNQIEKETP